MHMKSRDDERRILRMMPERYTWKACRLTRNLMAEGRSRPMQEALERLATWHMKGEKECKTGYDTPGGLSVSLARHTDPPPGFSTIDALLARMKNDSWTDENDEPPLEVEIHTTISSVGSAAWSMNQAILAIVKPPGSIVTRLISGDCELKDIVDGPYTQGFSIHSVWWRGEHWKGGEKIAHNAPAELSDKLEIMLEGAHDFQPIRIKP